MKFLFLLLPIIASAQVSTDTTAAAAPSYTYALSTFNTITPTGNFDMLFMPSGFTPNGEYFNRPATMTYTDTQCGGSPPAKGCIRDTSIGKIGSTWYMPYTCFIATGWCMTSTTNLGNALTGISPTWATTVVVTVGTNSFAPEWVRNPSGTVYLDSAAVGCAANTTPHITFTESDVATFWKIYEMHPLDHCTDPMATVTWSTPVQQVTTGDSTLVLDSYIVCIKGSIAVPANCDGTGNTFYMWYTHLILNTTEFIQYSSSTTLTGTYTQISPGGNWMSLSGTTHEGPKIITFGGAWRFFFDQVQGVPGDLLTGQLNWADTTDNWATFPNVKALATQQQAKHGTVIPYP